MDGFVPFAVNSPYSSMLWTFLVPMFFIAVVLIVVLTFVLKGFALWLSARAGQKWWFIAFLVINTFGILEIVYLIWFRPEEGRSGPPARKSSSAP